jgi:hypothetical protein
MHPTSYSRYLRAREQPRGRAALLQLARVARLQLAKAVRLQLAKAALRQLAKAVLLQLAKAAPATISMRGQIRSMQLRTPKRLDPRRVGTKKAGAC